MGALNEVSLSLLSPTDLKAVCESLGLSFAVIGQGERLEVSGNLAGVDDGIREAIKTHRDDLIALVYLVDMHGEPFSNMPPIGSWCELDALINEVCDKVPYDMDRRQAMLNARKNMRPMDIPHCIEHFKQCLVHVRNGTHERFRH